MKYLTPFLLLPGLLYGQRQQPVEPVLSADYTRLIRQQRATIAPGADSTLRRFHSSGRILAYPEVASVKISGQRVTFLPPSNLSAWLSGGLTTSVERRQTNRLPALQQSYAQGRAMNGALTWQGAETGEMFSYGPALHALEFDGSSYAYDSGGRLVPEGTGNGREAKAYDNSPFRTASYLSQSLTLNGGINTLNGSWLFNTRMGYSREEAFIRYHASRSDNLSASLAKRFNRFSFSGHYKHLHNRLSNNNRNGFLNRAYMHALLAPASFDNRYSGLAYGAQADNAEYLLATTLNNYILTQQNTGLVAEYNWQGIQVKLTQSFETVGERSREAYPVGTAGFPAGTGTQRHKTDRVYYLKADVSYPLRAIDRSDMHNHLKAAYIFTDAHTDIRYVPQAHYRCQRSASQLQLGYAWNYRLTGATLKAEAANIFYVSNTAGRTPQCSPLVVARAEIDVAHAWALYLDASLHQTNNELPVSNSFAYATLLQIPAAGFIQYFPLQEAAGYDGLLPVGSTVLSAQATVSYNNLYTLSGEWSRKMVRNDVFPVMKNGGLQLHNMADHRREGFEIVFSQYARRKSELSTNNFLSLLGYRHRVTKVTEGYEGTPIAGFADVHNSLATGETMGALTGSSWQRDAANNIVTGTDGFPLINTQRKVIGNPIPDFVLKWTNRLFWRSFSLTTDWQWSKGGQFWNGTQAALDYYGRSAATAAQRNVTGFVFTGVQENGHPNNQPVSFYDPGRPFTENRWVRYGLTGVAEEYVQPADHLRLSKVQARYEWTFKKVLRSISLSAYAANILVWTAVKDVDPAQLLLDQPAAAGLSFFNLPSVRSYGLNASLQF